MESIEIEGSSIEEAVERACDALNTTAENLEYNVVNPDAASNANGRGRQTKKIKIVAKKREAMDEGAPLSNNAAKAKGILETMLKMIDETYSVTAYDYPDRLVLNIKGDGSGLLIGKRGQTLDAIQHIMIKIINKGSEEATGEKSSKKIIVDTEKYREKRMDYLKSLAKKLAEKAISTGRPVSLDPMSSFERRIVHMALDKEEGVYTESVGEGSERQVVIKPKNER